MKKRLLAIFLTVMILLPCFTVVSASQPKLVALTFDDGPGPYTQSLLDGLAERGVRATFFCQGSRAEQYPDLIRRIVADGHQLANHSYNHPNLNELSLDRALKQIQTTDQIFNDLIGGSEAYYVRPPYGNTTQTIRKEMLAPVIIWSVDTIDWQLLNTEAVKNKILHDTFDGSIVLMHDIHRTTIGAVLEALDTLESRGYEFVTVKELLRRRGITPIAGQQYHSCKPNGTDEGKLLEPELSVSGTSEEIVVSLNSPTGAPVYYTLDGSDLMPDHAELYSGPITVRLPCVIRAVAAWDLNGDRSPAICCEYTLPPAGEPTVSVENGRLNFDTSSPQETVFVSVDSKSYVPYKEAVIEPDTDLYYYADADGYVATDIRKILFTSKCNLFTDISREDWFYSAMDHCVAKGYFEMTSDFKMNPQGQVTRAMLAVLLYRHAGSPSGNWENPFRDVPDSSYYAAAVSWGYHEGILNGTGNGWFAPDRYVNRQEAAKLLAAYLKLDVSDSEAILYSDQQLIAVWARPYVCAVTASGLMQGSSGRFNPYGTSTRAEIAAILERIDQ